MNRREFLCSATACACLPGTHAHAEADALETCAMMPPSDIAAARAFADQKWAGNKAIGNNEAGGLKSKRWDPALRELRVKFMTESTLSDRIFSAAKGWEDHMPLRFHKVSGNETADILFGTVAGNGHWSNVGTDSGFQAAQGIQSMNFGWVRNPNNAALRRTALHEFGHAMGLVHEHSLPGNTIDWDKPAVYAHYEKTYGWKPDRVNANVFKTYSEAQVNRTTYDPKSIMHYPVEAELVTDPDDVVGWNLVLSPLDKALIKWLWTPA